MWARITCFAERDVFHDSSFGLLVFYRLLQGTDVKNTHAVYGRDVELMASKGSGINQPGTTGSSKVRTCSNIIPSVSPCSAGL